MTPLLPLLILAAQDQAAASERPEPAPAELTFRYVWPAEADSVPNLRRWLAARREQQQLLAAHEARQQRGEAGPDETPPGHDYDAEWTSHGRAGRLLSLSALVARYTGGAHGNAQFEGLVWDVGRDRAVPVARLLGPGWQARYRARYCAALDDERRAKDVPVGEPGAGDRCPALAGHVVVPEDEDHDGRFERLRILLPPYAAGSYVEGTYEPSVRFTAADIRAIPAEYRTSFER